MAEIVVDIKACAVEEEVCATAMDNVAVTFMGALRVTGLGRVRPQLRFRSSGWGV